MPALMSAMPISIIVGPTTMGGKSWLMRLKVSREMKSGTSAQKHEVPTICPHAQSNESDWHW